MGSDALITASDGQREHILHARFSVIVSLCRSPRGPLSGRLAARACEPDTTGLRTGDLHRAASVLCPLIGLLLPLRLVQISCYVIATHPLRWGEYISHSEFNDNETSLGLCGFWQA